MEEFVIYAVIFLAGVVVGMALVDQIIKSDMVRDSKIEDPEKWETTGILTIKVKDGKYKGILKK